MHQIIRNVHRYLPSSHSALQNYMIAIDDVYLPPKLIFHLFGRTNIVHGHLPRSQALGLWHHIGKIVLFNNEKEI